MIRVNLSAWRMMGVAYAAVFALFGLTMTLAAVLPKSPYPAEHKIGEGRGAFMEMAR